jgi:hypothetical protein
MKKLLHTCVLERVVDVRDHALLLLPLPPAVARPRRGADKMARWFWLARQG